MSMKYKLRKLKEHLEKKSYQRYWYRIDRFDHRWYITYEHRWVNRKLDFLMKKLGCVQIWHPLFYMTTDIIEWWLIPNLAWLFFLRKHWEMRWSWRIWEKKVNQISQQKNREYRDMIREQTEKINYIHTIFYEKR